MLLRLLLIICIHIPVVCCCQQLIMLNDSANVSIRGMSVVNDNIVWVSGSNGMTGRSVDGGNTWQWKQVKGFEKNDFRDIEAFDAVTAVIMSIGDPAYILKTNDGGNTWKVVFEDKRKGMFLDAMEFWNEQSGIVIGDPVEGKIFIARTFDGGDSWQHLPVENYPAAKDGEAFFAASGTNVRALSLSEAVFVSGGQYSRFFMRNERVALPLLQGSQTTGANSIAVLNNKNRKAARQMVVVGGDFAADTLAVKNAALSADGGKTWVEPQTPPHGYRSCVEYISRSRLITCGTSGVDVSEDGGKNWKLISKESFHVCRKAKNGKAVFLAGKGGRIAQLLWQ